MKVVEILRLGRIFLEVLHDSCINIEDVRFLPLYDEYIGIIRKGGKVTYAVALLSEKYGISERKVYYILKRFGADCKIGAVEE